MPDTDLCDDLINAADASKEQEEAFRRAAESEICLAQLLSTAREQLGSDPAEALRCAKLARRLAEFQGEWTACAQAGRIQAQALRAQGDHAQAIEAFDLAAEDANRAENPLLAAQVQIGKVDSLGWLGDYAGAMTLARRLETGLEALGASEDVAKVQVNRGSLHLRRDQYAEALQCFDRAQILLADCDNPTALGQVQFNMATTLMEVNRMEEALRLFDSAREIFAAQEMIAFLAKLDANRGFLLALSGRPSSAIIALTHAREEFASRGQNWEAAKCDADMAESYQELNLHVEALECFDRAIAEFEKLGIVYERARAEAGRAGVLTEAGRDPEALEALQRAETLFRTHRNTTRLAHVRLLKAAILHKQGQAEQAREEARRAASALHRKGRHGWAAEARFLALDTNISAENRAVASITPTPQTIRALTGIRRTARKWARGWLECRVEQTLGHCFLRREEVTRALKHFRAGVAVLEQTRTEIVPETMHVAYLRDKLSIYEDIVAVLLERGRPRDVAEALQYVERAKSRLLLERIQQTLEGRTADTDFPPQTQARLADLRSELNRIYHQLHALDDSEARRFGTTDEVVALNLEEVEEAYRRALNAAETARPASEQRSLVLPEVPSVSALQSALQFDEALVEFSFVQGQVCAFVVTAEQMSVHRLAPETAVRHALRRLRRQLERASWTNSYTHQHSERYAADSQVVLAQLYDLLWRPLEAALTMEKIVVVPHGELHGLPLHALFDGRDYALDRWELVYAPSAAFWYANRQRRQDKSQWRTPLASLENALLIGVPEAGIERVTSEVDTLASLLPCPQTLLREAATLEAVQQLAPDCRIFHIATHALYRADNPLFSGLKLADSWLLARDLYQMRLNCDLATLSACQTGTAFVDAGDELFGLVRGFLSAGARSVAASLWSADDSATAALMEPFYRGVMQGKSLASALRAAQQELRRQYSHPYFWGAFALFGERGDSLSA